MLMTGKSDCHLVGLGAIGQMQDKLGPLQKKCGSLTISSAGGAVDSSSLNADYPFKGEQLINVGLA